MNNLVYIDTHCHLNDEAFDEDRDEVVKKAQANGITAIIDSSIDYATGLKSLELQSKFPGFVFSSLGFEPALIDDEEFHLVYELIKQNKDTIIAIGEVGLDYYRTRDALDQEKQRSYFQEFIRLALNLDKPLIVHSRSAGKYALEILFEEAPNKVMMHAFDGKMFWADKGVKSNFYFSVPTSVWYSKHKIKLARTVPIAQMLLETDSPVLGPERGMRNEPQNIHFAAKKIAEIKEMEPTEVIRTTTENAINFFNLPIKT